MPTSTKHQQNVTSDLIDALSLFEEDEDNNNNKEKVEALKISKTFSPTLQ